MLQDSLRGGLAMPALSAFPTALILASGCGAMMSSSKAEYYTQNAMCLQNNCVNPIFPGFNDLAQLNQIVWQCTTHNVIASYLDFCKEAVNYNPSLPSPNTTSQPINVLVKQQDDAATTMYYYHLNGLGFEASEHRDPARSEDNCVKAIWKLVCFTYFPKTEAGCELGQASPYLRPCRNCCEHYIESCQVECCDESVQCVFSRAVSESDTENSLLQLGYADRVGPSALCTGSKSHSLVLPIALLFGIFAAHMTVWDGSGNSGTAEAGQQQRPSQRVDKSSFRWALRAGSSVLILFVAMTSLQGCEVDLPHHTKGNWEKQPNYLVAYEFIPPGKHPNAAVLNSCSVKQLAPGLECSGRGYCKEFSPKDVVTQNAISFCECDRDWTDPECRTRRKSQIKLFFLSLFGGFFGLDYFYLDYPFLGSMKLCTFGGLGVWWLIDVVRTGSGPVYGWRFRVANDLPHWVYVLVVVTLAGFLGFVVGIESYLSYRKTKREDIMKLQESEEARQLGKMEDLDGPRFRSGLPGGLDSRRRFQGYGATMCTPSLPHGGAPMAGPQVSRWASENLY